MRKISIYETSILLLGIILSIMSAAICMQIMGQFGTSPNTSLIGAVLVMVVARIPLSFAKKFRNLERQNYVLSMASASGFAAANCGFVAIATMFILGRNDLIIPMAFGTLIGSMISVFVVGKIFGSRIFPAEGEWPTGEAIATSLQAGDEGGKKGFHLLQGLIVGAIAGFFGVPAAGVGIAFIANMVAMAALGIGMILRGYSPYILGFDIGTSNIAQGVMIGAGIVAFVQIFFTLGKKEKAAAPLPAGGAKEAKAEFISAGAAGALRQRRNSGAEPHLIENKITLRTFASSVGLFICGAVAIALVMGIFSEMGLWQSVAWVVFAGIASVVVMVLVGTATMHSGWGPTFAVVTICLTVGLLVGFPPLPLAVLVGYLGSVGPCMMDTSVGLKAGWVIRGKGVNKENETHGRKQQVMIKQLGIIIGIAMAVAFGVILVQGDIIPPMSIFYADTVASTPSPALLRELAMWAIPGAILQAAFGNRSAGLMLASGLLINNPIFGISVLVAIIARLVFGTKHMSIRAPGLIAGDGLFGFGESIFRAFWG